MNMLIALVMCSMSTAQSSLHIELCFVCHVTCASSMHTTGRCPWGDSLVFLIASLTSKSISSKNNKSSLLQPSWRPRTPRCIWEFEAAWPIAPLRRTLKPIYKFMTKPKISSTWNFGKREGGALMHSTPGCQQGLSSPTSCSLPEAAAQKGWEGPRS